MTLASTAPIVTYLENGATVTFAVPFQFIASSDLVVTRQAPDGTRTLAVLGGDYSVAGGAGATGSITTMAAKAAGWKLEIKRFTARTQPTDYTPGDTFPAETHEAALDREMAVSQEIEAEVTDISARALRVPMGETVDELPAAASRAGKILGFDVTGLRVLRTMADWLAGVAITITTAAGASVPTRGLLAGIIAPSDGQTAYLNEKGYQGWFTFRATNFAAEVALNPQQGIYVAKSGNDGSAGAWVRDINSPFVRVTWWGAKGDGVADDSGAINAAIAWLGAHGGGTLYFPNGVYLLANAMQDTGASNAQIVLPKVTDATQACAIRLLGETPPITSGVTTTGCAVIRSTSTTAGGSVIGVKTSGDGTTFCALYAENIVVEVPQNPVINGLDLRYTHHHNLRNVRITVAGGMTNTGANITLTVAEPTGAPLTLAGYGILGSLNNVPIWNQYSNVLIFGFVVGMQVGELTNGDDICISCCKYAVRFIFCYHPSRFGRLLILTCANAIWATGDHDTYIQLLDVEHTSANIPAWVVYDTDIVDPNNHFRGEVTWHMHDLTGIHPFVINGATNLRVDHCYTPDLLPEAFNRIFAGFQSVTSASAVREILAPTAAETPWHSLIARQTSTTGTIGAMSFSNSPPGATGDLRLAQIAAACDGATNSGNLGIGTSNAGVFTQWLLLNHLGQFFGKNTAAPGSNPVGGGYFWIEAGALKYRGSSGTVTTIAPA